MADTYVNTIVSSEQICSLMRRINALEAGVSSGSVVYQRKWGSSGSSNGQFSTLADVYLYGAEVYTTDTGNNRVQVFDTAGVYARKWGSFGSSNGQFNGAPIGICEYGGEIYVCDYGNNRVQVFSSAGVYTRKWTSANAYSIAAYNGEIYVGNSPPTDTISVYDTTGVLQRTLGSSGTGDGQFSSIYDLSFYGARLYVADHGNTRIQEIDVNGTFVNKWSVTDAQKIDATSGVVYVSGGSGLNSVGIYSLSGTYVGTFGTFGSGDGEFSLTVGIAVSAGEVYVGDFFNHRIQVFSASSGVPQTEFNSYTTTTATSLGTPDGGVSIPSLNGLAANSAGPIYQHITDMRTAIETLAPYFTNAITGNPFNFTNGSADNLYYVAMGDRSAYGATGGAQYTWTRDAAALNGATGCSIDIGELHETISLLEAS